MLSERQRIAAKRHTPGELVWLLIPGPAWRRYILPLDQPELGALRRRLLVFSGGCVAVAAALFWTLGAEPPAPVAKPASAPLADHPAPSAEIPGSPQVPATPAETAHEPSAPVPTEASLAEKRTQPALFSTAKVSAVYEGHDVRGVRVERVGSGSFWEMVGVRSGDVVIAYNDVPVDTPTAMIALLNSMEDDTVIRLRVRGTDANERTLYYSTPR